MVQYEKGMIVVSQAGHDMGERYMIQQVEEQILYLVNGKNRTLDNPKKKKKIHVQVCCHIPKIIEEKLESGKAIKNEDIKRVIGG